MKNESLLKDEESIIIKTPEDIINKLQYIKMKINSYENLFMSYLNNTIEEANEFNLQKFLDIYYKVIEDEYMLINSFITNSVGEAYINAINKREYDYVIDYINSIIIITKVQNTGCKACNL